VVGGGVAAFSNQREGVDHPSDKAVDVSFGGWQGVFDQAHREHALSVVAWVFEGCVTIVAQATDFVNRFMTTLPHGARR
jgi:hypothetical protein